MFGFGSSFQEPNDSSCAIALTANTVLLCRSRTPFFSVPPFFDSVLTPVIFKKVFYLDDRNRVK